jgi:hypothetical protein
MCVCVCVCECVCVRAHWGVAFSLALSLSRDQLNTLRTRLLARLDAANGNAVRATLVAAVLTANDLAGNSIKTRTTALFAPVGYAPAAIQVDAFLHLLP